MFQPQIKWNTPFVLWTFHLQFRLSHKTRVETHRRHSDVLFLNDGHDWHLYAGEHGELPGQVEHHAEHEAGFHEAANHCVGVECHCAAHLVHITLQAGRETSWGGKSRNGEIYVSVYVSSN